LIHENVLQVKRTPLTRRGKSRFPRFRDEQWLAYIRSLPCLIGNNCEGPTEPDHVRTRAAGGLDIGNTVPLCRRHHHQRHHMGIESFQQRYVINLAKWATLLGALDE
jgi:hypothetical protein